MAINNPTRAGYVSDSFYASVPKSEQSPVLLSYIAAAAGYLPPDPAKRFRYLELGCGTGTSLNLLAAACPEAEFEGIDINRNAIEVAIDGADRYQLTNVSYRPQAFSDLQPADLAQFDYIVCQGTYSWLPDREKEAIHRIVDECLKPGGIFHLHYVSFSSFYMTGMWHVLRQIIPAEGLDSVERVRAGLQVLVELRDSGARYFQNYPQALELLNNLNLQAMPDSQVSNLAHNILADALAPTYFDDIANTLQKSGLQYCGDIDTRLNDPELCLPSALQQRYSAARSPMEREFLKEFCLSNYGRKDIYVRAKALSPEDARAYLRQNVAATISMPPDDAWRAISTQGKRSFYEFNNPLVEFVFDCIVAGENNLESIIAISEYDAEVLEDVFMKLSTCQFVELCVSSALTDVVEGEAPLEAGCRFNKLMLDRAISAAGDIVLAAPALAGWVVLSRDEALLARDACDSGRQKGDSGVEPGLAQSRRNFVAHRLPYLVAVGALRQREEVVA